MGSDKKSGPIFSIPKDSAYTGTISNTSFSKIAVAISLRTERSSRLFVNAIIISISSVG